MSFIKALPQPRFSAVRETLAERGQAGRLFTVWRGGKAIGLMPDENGEYADEA